MPAFLKPVSKGVQFSVAEEVNLTMHVDVLAQEHISFLKLCTIRT